MLTQNSMDKPLIYLSCGFYNDSKKVLKQELTPHFDLIDPELQRGTINNIPGFYVGRDLRNIANSDLVVAIQNDHPGIYGVAAEIGYAVGKGKDVIYICKTARVDGFLAGCSRAIFTDSIVASEFIKERYSNG